MTMQVSVIAATRFNDTAAEKLTGWTSDAWQDADALSEFAGRACYQSWGKPNPATASNHGYMDNILRQGHFSVLEHASVSFYVTGVSRALTHELVRHRHLSFSQLSQRYVDGAQVAAVTPPAVAAADDTEDPFLGLSGVLGDAMGDARYYYGKMVAALEAQGLPRKQVREAARAVLPNMTETRLVVTGNHRAWRDVLAKRWHVAADAEIREFAGLVLRELRAIAPNTYQDVPEEPYA